MGFTNFAFNGVAAPYAGGSFYIDETQDSLHDLLFQLVMEDAPAANDPPTDILLSSSSVAQSGGVNAVVGNLSSVDPDDGDIHSYQLVAGVGDNHNAQFNISGSQLRTNNAAAMAAGDYSVRIRTTDSAANTFAKAFTITVLDDVPPVVNSVAVPPSDIYSTGHSLDFTLNASEALTVNTMGGTPRITLDIGGTSRFASYLSGSGTTAVMFRYTVQAGDNDLDGIEVSTLQLNGGTIRDNAGNNLNVTLNSVGNTTGVLVDTMPPSITAIANQTVGVGQSTAVLGFTIADNLTAAGSLSVNRASSNTIAVPLANVVLGGSGANRTVSITGADTGTSTITITVTDAAGNSAQQAFQVEVTPPSYTVNFVDWDGTVLKTETVSHGSSATAPANPSRTGYSFTGWSPGDFSNITADTTITAQYSINSYTLTFDSAGGSAVAAITQEFGSAITPPANPSRTGYQFAGWNPAIPATMPAANQTLTAQWTAESYTVNFVDWDATVLKTEVVNHGSGATAPANPIRPGYTFTGWSPSDFSVITTDTTITAQYNEASYTLTFDSAGGSAVAAITANFGTDITPPEPPSREGFVFVGWQPELPATMPAEDRLLTAQWEQSRFQVSASIHGEGSITPASQQIDFGNSASFTLSVAEDTFVQIDSNCAAARSGNQVITAAIKADCDISLTIHLAITLEVEDSSPAASQETRRFRLSNGAGEQVLSALQQTRSGTTDFLDLADAATLLTMQDDGSYLFTAERTGRYSFEFTDSVSGEQVMVSFDVLPFIAFTSASQPVQQNVPAQLSIWLSDEPIDYPVQVQVQGNQANVASHFELNAIDNLRRAYTITATSGDAGNISLQDSNLTQALLGSPHHHHLLVQTAPLPLALDATVMQAGTAGLVVQRSGGLVELSATELSGIAADYNWQGAGLEITQSGATASFDPSSLATGRHYLQLTAEAGDRLGELELALNVIADCPVADCSNSGISGIPSSQNQFSNQPNRLPLCPQGHGNNRVAQCQGQAVLFAEIPGLYQLTLGLHSEFESWQSGQFGLALREGSLNDTGFRQLGFLVNLDVVGLQSPGESVPVAIPLPAGQSIPANAVWRKLVNGRWQNFVEDNANRIDSAPRNALGNCPVVSSDNWRSGLNQGDSCIRLTIEDGGPNDDDGRANSVIRDPGVLAQQQMASVSFDSSGGSEVATITALVGSALTAPEPPSREGYTFTGWLPEFPATMPEDDVQLTAQWQINQYVIRFDVDGGQAIPDLLLDFGATISEPTATRSGYTFSGWSPALPTTMPAQDLQVKAQWQPSSVTVTSSGSSLGFVSAILLVVFVMLRRYHQNNRLRSGLKMLTASLLLLPITVFSQDWYLGVQGGEAKNHSSGHLASAVERKLNAAGVTGTVTLESNSDKAYRLFAGYRWNHWLATEFGWLDLGEAVLHYDGLPENQPQATLKAQPQRGRGAELSMVGSFALNELWQPYVRLALFDNRSRYRFEGTAAQSAERRHRIRLGAEFGIGYQLNTQLQLSAAAAHYNTEHFNTRMWSLGLRYSF
ncbi:InlB B-repeat-containing protein [Alkalimonas mucilaginosa]|uniref:InlB B-repeat-containing protein n=1 Tax=Alkalimonas mucilaginosa TaxID=3057676 RepID=A0ABU7JBC0_9GAMM|nr:InlB B-repeat-containing protein [Alkalimonas sp. MEB004]MEE2022731.1 InlB B-repeat-containing protein [Alkalimonas sp. MEB004]